MTLFADAHAVISHEWRRQARNLARDARLLAAGLDDFQQNAVVMTHAPRLCEGRGIRHSPKRAIGGWWRNNGSIWFELRAASDELFTTQGLDFETPSPFDAATAAAWFSRLDSLGFSRLSPSNRPRLDGVCDGATRAVCCG